MSVTRSLRGIVRATTPSGPPAAARVIVGAAAALKSAHIASALLPRLGETTVRVPAFDLMPPATVAGVTAILSVWLVASLLFTIGWRTRIAGCALVGSMILLVVADLQFYSNHLYLHALLVFLLTVADAGASSSVDSVMHGHRDWIPAWPVMLFCAQLSLVYGFAAIAKLNPEFLSGAIIAQAWRVQGVVPLPDLLNRWEFMAPLGIAAFLVEAFLAVGFWVTRWRRAAAASAIGLHVTIILTMGGVLELTIFTALMFSMIVVFLGPELRTWRARRLANTGLGRLELAPSGGLPAADGRADRRVRAGRRSTNR